MKKDHFKKIADKVYAGIASDNELNIYNSYYKLYQKSAEADLNLTISEENGKLIYDQILQQLDQQDLKARRIKTIKMYAGVAASAAVLCIVSYFGFFSKNDTNVKPVEIVARTTSKENFLVQLPDGSTVILSNGSTLKYTGDFSGESTRDVYLTGQGFFDIKHNESKPFLVHSGDVVTRVLGTAFDVNTKGAANSIIVRVIRGKVAVSNTSGVLGTLTPGKQIVYQVSQKKSVLSSIDAQKATEWREDDLFFNDISFEEAALLLASRFNVSIQINDDELSKRRFTTTLYENQSLEEFLTLLCDFNGARFNKIANGNQIIIEPTN